MGDERIYAISLWQPWASLIFARDHDGKRIKVHETRHWVPREQGVIKRGMRIAIHAAKTMQGYRDMSDDLHEICSDVFPYACAYSEFLPRGALLGTVELHDWYPTGDGRRAASHEDFVSGNWADGRYAWYLAEPDLESSPIPTKGQQGFWRIGDEPEPAPKVIKPVIVKPRPAQLALFGDAS